MIEPTGGKSELTYGGAITVGITQDLDGLDPQKALSAGAKEVLFNIFEGLVSLIMMEIWFLLPAKAIIFRRWYDLCFTYERGVKFRDGLAYYS